MLHLGLRIELWIRRKVQPPEDQPSWNINPTTLWLWYNYNTLLSKEIRFFFFLECKTCYEGQLWGLWPSANAFPPKGQNNVYYSVFALFCSSEVTTVTFCSTLLIFKKTKKKNIQKLPKKRNIYHTHKKYIPIYIYFFFFLTLKQILKCFFS